MTQKSILSFFVPKSQKNTSSNVSKADDENCSADDFSPIKTTKSQKRHRISSSSESEVENEINKQSSASSCTKKSMVEKLTTLTANDKECSNQSTNVSKKIEKNSLTQKAVTEKNETCEKKDISFTVKTQQNKRESNLKDATNSEKQLIKSYNPNSPNYHPIEHACWKHGDKVPYYALAKTLEEIEKVSARLKMIEILSNFMRSIIVLTPEDLLPCIYLTLNKLGPNHEGLELGLAEQTLIKAISQCTGRTAAQIKNDIHQVGDLGLVAEKSRACQKLMVKPQPLSIRQVFKKFTEIATMSGKTILTKKISSVENLLTACDGVEAKFLIRSLIGKLRIGLAEQSVLQALALACAMTPPGQPYPPNELNASTKLSPEKFKEQVDKCVLLLKTTYCQCPNYNLIINVLLKEGINALPDHCKIKPGLPIKPMLAQPTKGVQEVLRRFDGMEFTCEWKYDGERAQIHFLENGTTKIYSRNQEDNTTKYPDVISRIGETKKDGVTSFILDCEVVAWCRESNRILPFQVLSTRKKKDVDESKIKVQVCVFAFDLLYLNGQSLVKENLIDRRRLIRENFNEVSGKWMFAKSIDSSQMEEVQEFLEESIKGNCEGLMVKTLREESTYEIAKRSRNWLKLKKDYLEGVGDTLDLVVLGGYLGKGKRTGIYGGFLIGCYDEHNEEYQSVCRIGTGFSEESLVQHTEFFKTHVINQAPSYYQYDDSVEPDHWFEPIQVWETKCADLSLSTTYRAAVGVVDPEKGISLRFPRFLRVRDDKKPEEATTSQEIIHLYNNQEQVKNQQKFCDFQDDDFF